MFDRAGREAWGRANMRQHFPKGLPPLAQLDPRADDELIIGHALRGVQRVRAALAGVGRHERAAVSPEELTLVLDSIAKGYQARPVAGDVGLSGRIGRMVDPAWWRRGLRHQLRQANERQEHAAGEVRRKKQVYVSDHAVNVTAAAQKRNAATLDRLEVVNDDGEACNLGEVAAGSVSNPKLRRAELMVRCRGFEETAKFYGHEAVFLTITAPSRFHRFNAQGKPNDKWQGETPKDAQQYLNQTWAKIRAEWKRHGYAPYGFRVAEPHHDGCPHWHILLFAPPGQIGWFVPRRFVADREDSGAGLLGVSGRHALSDSPGERGAVDHRFTVKRIDPEQGSATGYIAKYICKNIDGLTEAGDGMGLDFASGTPADKAAKRVRTWASTWGIRQFQQIGGPSVTVWRELRRLAKDAENPVLQQELFEGPRAAADRALWALFWVLQGGPDVPRSQLLRPFYQDMGAGKYGDDVTTVRGVQGVDSEGNEYATLTRFHTWTVQRDGLADLDAREGERLHRRDLEARYPELIATLDPEPEFEPRNAGPWTGVNNCTDEIEVDFLRGGGGKPNLENSHESIPPGPSGGHWRPDRSIERRNPRSLQ